MSVLALDSGQSLWQFLYLESHAADYQVRIVVNMAMGRDELALEF